MDPQPHCVEYVRVASAASGFGGRMTTMNAFVAANGSLADGSTSVSVPVRSGCWGTFPVPTGEHVKNHFKKFVGGNASIRVPVVDPNSLIGDDEVVVVMKIDTEGAELDILRALAPSLSSGRVLNVMAELNKKATVNGKEVYPKWKQDEVLEVLTEVVAHGFTVYCAQFGNPSSFDYTPAMRSREALELFVADGWRSANVWIARDFEALPESG